MVKSYISPDDYCTLSKKKLDGATQLLRTLHIHIHIRIRIHIHIHIRMQAIKYCSHLSTHVQKYITNVSRAFV